MRVKNDFFNRNYFKIGDGSWVHFWEDIWLGDTSLAQQYSSLYNIVQRKNILVATVLAQTPLDISFRRDFNEHKWNQWIHLCRRLMVVHLSDKPGKFVWKLTES
jgi:hypothetical protein